MARKGAGKGGRTRRGGRKAAGARLWVRLGTLGVVLAAAAALAVALSMKAPAATTVPEALRVQVVRSYPHAGDAFTQGLVYGDDGWLYESTGLVGRSSLRRVELESGRVVARADVEAPLFAEGLALVDGKLLQLTWHAGKLLVWDRKRLEHRSTRRYEGEGWGLCFDGEQLVMSDGSARLAFRDPRTFEARRRVQVTKVGRPVRHLNELECVGGHVYANVWQSEEIVRIDPESGKVTATIDASGLLSAEESEGVDVLNGIAHVPDRDTFLLTGKLWPRLFEVRFVPR
ncbi:MAG: glutaminyl-peptide cyclotransferase [Myxococcota bacterium]